MCVRSDACGNAHWLNGWTPVMRAAPTAAALAACCAHRTQTHGERPCNRCAREPGHRPARSGGCAAGDGGAGGRVQHLADTSPTSRRHLADNIEVLEASRHMWLRDFVPGETPRLSSARSHDARFWRV